MHEELSHGKLVRVNFLPSDICDVHNLLVVMRNLQRRSRPLISPGTGEGDKHNTREHLSFVML